MTRPGIEPRSPGPLANTVTARPTPPPKKKVICKSSIIPEASAVPNGSIEEEKKKREKKLKSLGKCPNTAKKGGVILI